MESDAIFWEGEVPSEPQSWIAMDVFSTTDEHRSPRMEWGMLMNHEIHEAYEIGGNVVGSASTSTGRGGATHLEIFCAIPPA
jgi:hypothetical protein